MKDNYTHIVMILDRSGSMQTIKRDTIDGFNKFLHEQKQVGKEATITLVQFNESYEVVYENMALSDSPPLTNLSFQPRGSTALIDAIGKTINSTGTHLGAMSEWNRPDRVVFVIITDGEENASREFNKTQINEMIDHQREKYSWNFVFIGANQDAIKSAQTYGVGAANALTYGANAVGTASAFDSLSKKIGVYRVSARMQADSSLEFDDNDKEEQKKAGVK